MMSVVCVLVGFVPFHSQITWYGLASSRSFRSLKRGAEFWVTKPRLVAILISHLLRGSLKVKDLDGMRVNVCVCESWEVGLDA